MKFFTLGMEDVFCVTINIYYFLQEDQRVSYTSGFISQSGINIYGSLIDQTLLNFDGYRVDIKVILDYQQFLFVQPNDEYSPSEIHHKCTTQECFTFCQKVIQLTSLVKQKVLIIYYDSNGVVVDSFKSTLYNLHQSKIMDVSAVVGSNTAVAIIYNKTLTEIDFQNVKSVVMLVNDSQGMIDIQTVSYKIVSTSVFGNVIQYTALCWIGVAAIVAQVVGELVIKNNHKKTKVVRRSDQDEDLQ
uniref:Uncharacterized protein n=1 Tax=Trepomonas sp. PC1 TaxID=1076344 RepID=A0A146JXU5_9EUKA|eukprot:JAP89570.1 Hypothetical protein TPC1_30935 [Trepomonas sp. PC1]